MITLSKNNSKRALSTLITWCILFVASVALAAVTPDTEAKIAEIISKMTLEEKINMLHANSLFTSAGVERFGIPEVVYTDGPFGIREEMGRDSWAPLGLDNDFATFFPTGPALAATWNVDLAYLYGVGIGEEARARGKDVLLGPAINIIRTPVCGRNFDYFTEDPFLNARMAVGYVKGAQEQDVAVCVKHYALNNQEADRGRIDVHVDERTLREIYMPAFRATVEEAGALTFMGSYNKFRGAYLCENDYLMNKLLRDEWGFRGFVVSDWGATHSTVGSALGGLEVEMGSRGTYDKMFMANPLLTAVKDSLVDEKIIDAKVENILYVIYSMNKMEKNRKTGAINTPEHQKTVYNVAAESIILLKNDKILPFDDKSIKSIAVIGDNAKEKHASGGFGAGVKAKYEITPIEGIQNRYNGVTVNYAQGYKKQHTESGTGFSRRRVIDNTPDQALIDEAVKAAKESDVAVVFAGSNREVESEARDRADLQLPFGQVELIQAVAAANPRSVVVIIAGAPFDLSEIQKTAPAILWSSFNGSEAGNAFADVLFGKVNPSGKLPYTIPVKLQDSPAHALGTYPGENGVAEYKEGLLVGYRWFDTKEIAPLYCFGHGLSYTQFDYSKIKTNKKSYKAHDTIELKLKIKNTGKTEGAETIQLYVHNADSQVERPVKELKGFAKVFLQPGKSQNVSIKVKVSDLAYYNIDSKSWVVEPGTIELLAGSSSKDIRQTMLINIQ